MKTLWNRLLIWLGIRKRKKFHATYTVDVKQDTKLLDAWRKEAAKQIAADVDKRLLESLKEEPNQFYRRKL